MYNVIGSELHRLLCDRVKMDPLVVKVILERRETPEHLENKGYLDLPDKKGRGYVNVQCT